MAAASGWIAVAASLMLAIEAPSAQSQPAQSQPAPSQAVQSQPTLPPDAAAAKAMIDASSRHGEYVDIATTGAPAPVRAFVVYPEIATKAPVVIVLHEGFGFGDWTRGVADQLAAEGFIAISPDLRRDDLAAALPAVRAYGAKLPAATGKTVTLGFGFDGAALDVRGEADVEAASRAWPATLASLRQHAR
jgi:Dienelactone hydrolase family